MRWERRSEFLELAGPVGLGHGGFGEVEGLFGEGVGAGGALFEDGQDGGGVLFELAAAEAGGVDEGDEDVDEFALHVDVADASGLVFGAVLGDPGGVGVEGCVESLEGVFGGVGFAGVGGALAVGIGIHGHDFFPDGVGIVGEEDGVVEGLGHFEE